MEISQPLVTLFLVTSAVMVFRLVRDIIIAGLVNVTGIFAKSVVKILISEIKTTHTQQKFQFYISEMKIVSIMESLNKLKTNPTNKLGVKELFIQIDTN